MAEGRFLGWTAEAWKRAYAWAGEPIRGDVATDIAVRRKWLDAGGPMDGPVSDLVLTNE